MPLHYYSLLKSMHWSSRKYPNCAPDVYASQEEILTSVFPIPFEVIQKMRHNRSWNHISNILSLFRSVNLKEVSCKNSIDHKNKRLDLRTSGLCTEVSKRYGELSINKTKKMTWHNKSMLQFVQGNKWKEHYN